ncbi:MAG: hypothetical protein QXJ93_01025 [Candidatus Rehaiarchaeum fermentans]|nr:hypothetical protein [Candidatus Rehaiarchaeum fermentans]
MRKIIGIFGIQGHGKTTYLKEITKNLNRVIYVDTLEEYNYKTITNPIELLDFLKDRISFKIEYVNLTEDTDIESLDKVCIAIKSYIQYMQSKYELDIDITLAVDEVDIYATTSFISQNFRELIVRGRHWNTNLIYATRRPHECNRLLTSQSNIFAIFKIIEPSDIAFFKTFIGEYAYELPELKRFEYLYCDLDSQIFIKKKLQND